MSRRVIAALLITGAVSGLVAALLLRPSLHGVLPAAFSRSDNATPVATPDPFVHVVAQATVPEVPVFATPSDTSPPAQKLASPNETGAPLIFLVRDQKPGWYWVLLPTRPNGS